MINRTAHFQAIKAKFPNCRFTPGDYPGMFHVELKGEVIATLNDSQLAKWSPEETASSISVSRKLEPKKIAVVSEPPKRKPGRPRTVFPDSEKIVTMDKPVEMTKSGTPTFISKNVDGDQSDAG